MKLLLTRSGKNSTKKSKSGPVLHDKVIPTFTSYSKSIIIIFLVFITALTVILIRYSGLFDAKQISSKTADFI